MDNRSIDIENQVDNSITNNHNPNLSDQVVDSDPTPPYSESRDTLPAYRESDSISPNGTLTYTYIYNLHKHITEREKERKQATKAKTGQHIVPGQAKPLPSPLITQNIPQVTVTHPKEQQSSQQQSNCCSRIFFSITNTFIFSILYYCCLLSNPRKISFSLTRFVTTILVIYAIISFSKQIASFNNNSRPNNSKLVLDYIIKENEFNSSDYDISNLTTFGHY